MAGRIVLVGSPTALGGHFDGMERTPVELRALGLEARLRARPGLAGAELLDAGDADNDPGWAPDPDARARNRARICEYLPRLADHVAAGLRDGRGPGADDAAAAGSARLLVVGGDCTTHAGAMAGIRRARPGTRLGIAWFDAHGDFNTPATT
ncbi:MAG: arginase family protein, partial [Candidatus Limnocylindrales bacterium]